MPDPITIHDFHAVDIRVARIVAAEPNSGARRPAYILTLDLGPKMGRRTSSAHRWLSSSC